jgi:hypothetical protein
MILAGYQGDAALFVNLANAFHCAAAGDPSTYDDILVCWH